MPRRRANGGLTLIEVAISIAILAVTILLLSAAMASAQRMTALAREQAIAQSAIRSYVETMRRDYPAQGSNDLTGFLDDTRTPADPAFLPASGSVESGVLKDVQAYVLKGVDETGANWGPAARSAGVAPLASAITADDRGNLKLPRDLDGDGTTTTTLVAKNKVIFVPIKIEISWRTGSSLSDSAPRQKLRFYAAISPQH